VSVVTYLRIFLAGRSAAPFDRADLWRPCVAAVFLTLAIVVLHDTPPHPAVDHGDYEEWHGALEWLRDGHAKESFDNLITANSGDYTMAPEVRDSLTLLRQNNVQDFTVAPKPDFLNPFWWQQRIAEFSFPRRMLTDAPYVLMMQDEEPPEGCAPIAREGKVQLARCY
jgi:hypothetical protein